MVTVPTQKTQRVQLGAAPTTFRDPRVPSGAFGGLAAAGLIEGGRQLQGAGAGLAQMALDIQRDDNDAEVKERDNQISEALRASMYGDGTANNVGYYGLERKEAVRGYIPTEDNIREAVENIAKESSNDAVRLKVSQLGAVRIQRELGNMTKHAAAERVKAFDEVSAAREAQASSDATNAWNNSGIMDNSLGIVADEAEDYARRHSLDEETAEVRLQRRQGVVIKSAFDAALTNDAVAVAEGLIAKHGDKLDGATHAEMDKALRTQTLYVKGQALAASAAEKFPQNPTAARQYIRDVSEGKVEDEAIRQFNLQIAEARGDKRARKSDAAERRALNSEARATYNHEESKRVKAEKQALEDANGVASDWLYDGKTLQELRVEKPLVWQLISRKHSLMNQLEATQRDVAEGKLFATSSDGETVKKFKTEDIKGRSEFNLNTIRQQVTPGEWSTLVDNQASAQRQMKNLKEDKSSYTSGRAAIIRSAQFPTAAKQTSKQKNMLNEAEQAMGVYITDVLESGRKPTQTEIDGVAGEIAVQVVSDPWGFSLGILGEGRDTFSGLSVRAGRMSEAQRASATISINKIPPAMNEQIDQWLDNRDIESISDSVREELAGAIVMRDSVRAKKLLAGAR